MRVLLSTVCILVSLLVSNVSCQDDGEGTGWSSLWSKFKAVVKEFTEQMREFWNDFKEEVRSRTTDMADWSNDVWTSFKTKMSEYIDGRTDATESERQEMRNYIERLQMKEDD